MVGSVGVYFNLPAPFADTSKAKTRTRKMVKGEASRMMEFGMLTRPARMGAVTSTVTSTKHHLSVFVLLADAAEFKHYQHHIMIR
jgi:hypothetical protein